MNKHRVFITVAFTIFLIGVFAMFNIALTPEFIWFHYGAFIILWWPLVEIIKPRQNPFGFSLVGSILIALLLCVVNMQYTPHQLWFLYSLYLLAWWPIAVSIRHKLRLKTLSIVVSALTIIYLVVINAVFSPEYPWFLYACYPFIWWPIVMFSNKRAATIKFAIMCTVITIAYYTALNILVSPGYPFIICIAFALCWWPITMHFAKVKKWVIYSIVGSVLITAFMIFLNCVSSPNVIWAIYPIFAVTWWPMTMMFQRKRCWFGYSIAGTLLFSIFMILVNNITSPNTLWYVYPIFIILWWPLSVYFFGYRKKMVSMK